MIALMLAFPVAFGAGLAGMITGSALTSRWFRRRRGRALGIYAMASSLAGLAITPASAAAIEALGWRSALIAQGFVLCVLIVTFGLVLMRDQPSAEQLRVEIDPNEVDDDRLDMLAAVGMNRASIGIQDFDPEIQKTIGREQGFEVTAEGRVVAKE